MWMLLKMAWRNLWRHRRRSFLTLLAMTIGLYACHVTLAIGDGAHRQMIDIATAGFLGQIQLNGRKYQDTRRQYLVVKDQSKAVRLLQKLSTRDSTLPASLKPWKSRLRGWSRRINGAGLVSTGDHSGGSLLLGLDLSQEHKVTRLPSILFRTIASNAALARPGSVLAKKQALFSSAYLQGLRSLWKQHPDNATRRDAAIHKLTKKLYPTLPAKASFWKKLVADKEIVLGKGLAATLKAKVGQPLAVITQALDGSAGNDRFTIVAIAESGNEELDHSLCILTLEAMRELLVMKGRSHQLILRLNKAEHHQIVGLTKALRKELASELSLHPGTRKQGKTFEVFSWNEVSPELYELIKIDEAGGYITIIILFMLVVFGILNTLLMSVMERIREFGLLQSLGLKSRRLMLLVVSEGMFLALVSTIVGFAFSIPTILYLYSTQVPLGEPMRMGGITFQMTLTANLTWFGVFFSATMVFVTTFLVSLFPAWKVRSLRPAEALRYQ
jgi:ABC-type lipoprotein release transport system permease subunit